MHKTEMADGERKTVTVLSVDIKDSTELIEMLDPEDARSLIDPALQLMIDAVRRYDGYVVQSTGDGVFAIFGAPVAREDHQLRALYAALRMQEDLRRHSGRLREAGGAAIEARIGLDTGEAVMRQLRTGATRTEYAPVGLVANMAVRMQTLARTGEIVVTGQMRKAGEGYFTFRSLGPTRVKGISEVIEVHELTGLGSLRTRLQVAARRGLTKFVGREAELSQLACAMELTRASTGQIVAVVGEPGTGKSRLLLEFKAQYGSEASILEAYSISHRAKSPYSALIELLNQYFAVTNGESTEERRGKIISKVLKRGSALQNTLPYFFSLLDVAETNDPLAQMDAQIKLRGTLDAAERLFLGESVVGPLILCFEDLQWIDDETQAFLNLLVCSAASARLLILLSYRPEYHHEWSRYCHYHELQIDPLGEESASAMISALLGDSEEMTLLKRTVAERSGGNPFFIEELVRSFFDQGVIVRNGRMVTIARSVSRTRLPATVTGVLSSRIDRMLPNEKALLQSLSVIGRKFPLSLIRRLAQHSGGELDRMLANLESAEFIYERLALPEVEYSFKHALTQEVAYGSLLAATRRLIHERVGAALEELHSDRLDEYFDELAHHYRLSDNAAKAVRYLQLASRQALRRSHYAVTIARASAALPLVDRLSEASQRLRAELALHLLIGQASMATIGPAAPEVEGALVRAEALCDRLGSAAEVFPVLEAMWTFYVVRAEHRRAEAFATRMMQIAIRENSDTLATSAYFALGQTSYFQGQFANALENLQHAISYRPVRNPTNAGTVDIVQLALMYSAWSLWPLGYPDQALAMCRKSVEHALNMNHLHSIAVARAGSCVIYLLRKDSEAVKQADILIAFATEHGFPYWRAMGHILRSRALLEEGLAAEALKGLSEIIPRLRTMGAKVGIPASLASLAQAHGETGNPAAGLAVITEALTEIEQTSERNIEAQLYRIKGELLLRGEEPNPAAAEDCFRHAIKVARSLEARSWELGAATSLSRLLSKQGRRNEATSILAATYSWFTEGFDTGDLRAARALLNDLRS